MVTGALDLVFPRNEPPPLAKRSLQLTPPDPAGFQGIFPIHFARDTETYVYGYRITLSSLFVVSGLR